MREVHVTSLSLNIYQQKPFKVHEQAFYFQRYFAGRYFAQKYFAERYFPVEGFCWRDFSVEGFGERNFPAEGFLAGGIQHPSQVAQRLSKCIRFHMRGNNNKKRKKNDVISIKILNYRLADPSKNYNSTKKINRKFLRFQNSVFRNF